MDRLQTFAKSKAFLVVLAVALLSVLALSVFLWSSWQAAEVTRQDGVDAIANLISVNQNLNEQYASLQQDLASLQSEYQGLALQRDQLTGEVSAAEAEADLLRSQKYYLADVLEWYSRQYLYPRYPLNCMDHGNPCPNSTGARDVGYMADTYAKATGNPIPQSCEFASADRYVHWASLQSRMYEVTPEKMGWTPFNSVFTNILFGPEHATDEPGYLGSIGYELRYPMVPGTWPFQELHTTVNAYTEEAHYVPVQEAVQTVELDCGIRGYIFLADDVDETKAIGFEFGTYYSVIKVKYFYKDLGEAVSILTQAANVVIHDFTIGF